MKIKHHPRQRISAKQMRFIDIYVTEPQLGASKAAEKAGYGMNAGSRLLSHPAIAAEVSARQAVLRRDSHYDVQEAMRECEESLILARQKGQMMAAAKLIELRSKLMGLLIEKLDVRQQTNFRINILGLSSPGAEPHDVSNTIPSPFVPLALNHAREVGEEIDDNQFNEPSEAAETADTVETAEDLF